MGAAGDSDGRRPRIDLAGGWTTRQPPVTPVVGGLLVVPPLTTGRRVYGPGRFFVAPFNRSCPSRARHALPPQAAPWCGRARGGSKHIERQGFPLPRRVHVYALPRPLPRHRDVAGARGGFVLAIKGWIASVVRGATFFRAEGVDGGVDDRVGRGVRRLLIAVG